MTDQIKPEEEKDVKEEEEEEAEQTLIGKALEEAMVKLTPLTQKQNELVDKLEEIGKAGSDDLTQKRLNVLGRKLEEAEVMGEKKTAETLQNQTAKIRTDLESRKNQIAQIGAEIDKIEAERKQIVKDLLVAVIPEIKQNFIQLLDDTITWIEEEQKDCEEVADQFGVRAMLPPSFFRELRIFREGPFREIRGRLDEYLP